LSVACWREESVTSVLPYKSSAKSNVECYVLIFFTLFFGDGFCSAHFTGRQVGKRP